MNRTYRDALQEAAGSLAAAGVEDAQLDAWYLLNHVTGLDRARYFMVQMDPMPDSVWEQMLPLIEKRAARIPLQHLLGEAWFMGLPFFVDEHVLIPRQDTEKLVELVLDGQKNGRIPENGTLLDMCTGSGCIAISLAVHGKWSCVSAADLSVEALAVAQQNAERNQKDVQFLHSDLFQVIGEEDVPKSFGKYDVIVSNPPYIPTAVIAQLQPEVRDHDPFMALDGLEDGLYFYRKLAEECPKHLNPGGHIFWEIGWDQGEDVRTLLQQAGFTSVEVIPDDTGKDRVVTGEWICLTD